MSVRIGLLPQCLLLGACASSVSRPTAGIAPLPGGSDERKPRIVVTTDPELDSNSLLRLLLYSTDFRIEGLVYASSQFHWKGDGTGKKWFVAGREYTRFGLNLCPCESWRWAPNERFIDDAIDVYERVYPNLRIHDAGFPLPTELRSRVRWGNVEFDGDISKDTAGSDLIRDLVIADEPEPIYLLAWGGASTIARALKSIQDRYEGTAEWPTVRARVSRRAILSLSGDQDDTYANYIRPNWPDVRALNAGVGGVGVGYGAYARASAENAPYFSADWTRANISSRGGDRPDHPIRTRSNGRRTTAVDPLSADRRFGDSLVTPKSGASSPRSTARAPRSMKLRAAFIVTERWCGAPMPDAR